MKILSKTVGNELEIIKIHIGMGLTIIVEVFKASERFKSFTRSFLPHYDDLLGYGVHECKKESIKQSIKDLCEFIRNFPG